MADASPYVINLDAEERLRLQQIGRSYSLPYREVVRARIILAAADGLDNEAIADRLGTCREVVSRWRKRFFEERLDGLNDGSRSGRPARFSPLGSCGSQGAGLPASR